MHGRARRHEWRREWFPDPPMQEVPLDVMSSKEIGRITTVPNKLVVEINLGRRAAA